MTLREFNAFWMGCGSAGAFLLFASGQIGFAAICLSGAFFSLAAYLQGSTPDFPAISKARSLSPEGEEA